MQTFNHCAKTCPIWWNIHSPFMLPFSNYYYGFLKPLVPCSMCSVTDSCTIANLIWISIPYRINKVLIATACMLFYFSILIETKSITFPDSSIQIAHQRYTVKCCLTPIMRKTIEHFSILTNWIKYTNSNTWKSVIWMSIFQLTAKIILWQTFLTFLIIIRIPWLFQVSQVFQASGKPWLLHCIFFNQQTRVRLLQFNKEASLCCK